MQVGGAQRGASWNPAGAHHAVVCVGQEGVHLARPHQHLVQVAALNGRVELRLQVARTCRAHSVRGAEEAEGLLVTSLIVVRVPQPKYVPPSQSG